MPAAAAASAAASSGGAAVASGGDGWAAQFAFPRMVFALWAAAVRERHLEKILYMSTTMLAMCMKSPASRKRLYMVGSGDGRGGEGLVEREPLVSTRSFMYAGT